MSDEDEAIASIKRMEKIYAERAARGELEPALPAVAEPAAQLPFWPEPVRRAPNTLLRSAFFAGIHSKKRRELGFRIHPDEPKQGVTIAAQEGSRITYAGDQLNQYDADVFFEALHRARGNPLPTECIFTGYDFLKAIGRTVGKREYQDLENSLRRLRFGEVQIEWKINGRKYKFVGGLINNFVREENSKLFKVTFAKEIRDLFAPACWTQLQWQERMALKGKPLAQWLHGFYCSHAEAFPLSAAYLHEKSGSARTVFRNFRTDLKNALAALEKILGWKAVWEGDLLTVQRRASASQIRHLNQKAAQRIGQSGQRRKRRKATPLFDFPELSSR